MKRFCFLFVTVIVLPLLNQVLAVGDDFRTVAAAMQKRQKESGGVIVYGKISARGQMSTPCFLDGKGNFATRVVREDGVVPFRLHGGYEPLDISVKEDFQKGGIINLGRLSFKRTEKVQISGKVNLPEGIARSRVQLYYSILHEPTKGRMENYSSLRDWIPLEVRTKPDGTFTIPDASPDCLYYFMAYAEDCQPAHAFIEAGADPDVILTLEKREIVRMPFGMEFVKIPPGRFIMGGSIHLNTHDRWMTIKKPFYIARTPLTKGQFEAILGRPNSGSKKPVKPGEISGDFSALLAGMSKIGGGRQFRLPKDEEWEYVARGATIHGPFNVPRKDLLQYEVLGSRQLMDVETKAANQYGVFDMVGNAIEATMKSERGGWHLSTPYDLEPVFVINKKEPTMGIGEDALGFKSYAYRFVFKDD